MVDALAFARAHADQPLAIRRGGHGINGRSTNSGGIVIGLGKLNTIEVLDQATRRVRIGPGARWMEVAARSSATAGRSARATTAASALAAWPPPAASAGLCASTA